MLEPEFYGNVGCVARRVTVITERREKSGEESKTLPRKSKPLKEPFSKLEDNAKANLDNAARQRAVFMLAASRAWNSRRTGADDWQVPGGVNTKTRVGMVQDVESLTAYLNG